MIHRRAVAVFALLLCWSGCSEFYRYGPRVGGSQPDAATDAGIITLLDGPPPERYPFWHDSAPNDAGYQTALDAGDACAAEPHFWICTDTGENFSSCGAACGTLSVTCVGRSCSCANGAIPDNPGNPCEMPEGTWGGCGEGAACISALNDRCCDPVR